MPIAISTYIVHETVCLYEKCLSIHEMPSLVLKVIEIK